MFFQNRSWGQLLEGPGADLYLQNWISEAIFDLRGYKKAPFGHYFRQQRLQRSMTPNYRERPYRNHSKFCAVGAYCLFKGRFVA